MYYYYVNKPNYIEKNKDLIDEIRDIFYTNRECYGYRRITGILKNRGKNINHKKVLKLMNIINIHPKIKKRKKYSSYKGNIGKVADNILNRNFKADKPNTKWATDITEFKINAGKVYLSPIMDLYNDEIIAFTIGLSPSMDLVLKMVDEAFSKVDNSEELLLHSDQGWQYQSPDYQRKLLNKGVKQSMSRKGNCNDNGKIEGFFGTLKNEMFYGYEKEFTSLYDLMLKISDYIYFYNNVRIKTGLNNMSPAEFRKQTFAV